MRKTTVIILSLLLLSTSVFASEGQPRDWTFSLGAKGWYADWRQQGADFGSDFVYGPTFTIRRKNIAIGGSYLTSSFSSSFAYSDRTDIDFYVSYRFNPYISLAVGYKSSAMDLEYDETGYTDIVSGVEYRHRNHKETLDFSGPGMGITGIVPIKETRFFVHWALSFSYMTLNSEATGDWFIRDPRDGKTYQGHDEFSKTGQVWAYSFEVNCGYSFSYFVLTLGFRYNEFSSFETGELVMYYEVHGFDYNRKGEDRFYGPSLTIVFKY